MLLPNLARAFLAGPLDAASAAARAAAALGATPPWLSGLARRFVARFTGATRPRFRQTLERGLKLPAVTRSQEQLRNYALQALRRTQQRLLMLVLERSRGGDMLAGVDADIWLLETPPFYDWAKYLDGPVVAIEYGTPPGYMFSPEIGRHLDAMVEARFTQVYTRLLPFDAIMSISESIHRWLPRRAQAFSSMIHLGADHYPRVARDGAEALRARLGFGHDDCMILWVGRMQLDNDEQPYKGFKELLALMPRVAARLERARFVLAGRVSETDQRRLEGEGLTVLANLPAEDLACALSAAALGSSADSSPGSPRSESSIGG